MTFHNRILRINYNVMALLLFSSLLSFNPILGNSSLLNSSFPALVEEKIYSNQCEPKFAVKHQTIHCLEELEAEPKMIPSVYSDCGKISEFYNTDEYYSLGCGNEGFNGWFKANRWAYTKIQGDGGVDVTGAPSVLLVEGANKALVEVVPGGSFSLEILIPADGFITFDWSMIGGSNLTFTVQYGDQVDNNPDHYFSSTRLKAGDSFTFRFKNPGEMAGKINFSHFQFFTDVTTILERTWHAVDQYGNQGSAVQFIGIKGINHNQIIMPADYEELPSSSRKEIPAPGISGYPVFDLDHDPDTKHDQVPLHQNDCSLDISWKDDVEEIENGLLINREWILKEGCDKTTIIHNQKIKLFFKNSSIQRKSRETGKTDNPYDIKRMENDPYKFMSSSFRDRNKTDQSNTRIR